VDPRLKVPEAAEHEHEFVVEDAGLLYSIPLYQIPIAEVKVNS
jgi:hypothetical protein